MMSLFEEAARCSDRAEEARLKAETYRNPLCIRTMQNLAAGWDAQAEIAATRALALAFVGKEPDMQSKGGLHPYRAALYWVLREQHTNPRLGRIRKTAVQTGNVANISRWPIVCCLAHAFDKTGHEVARDLCETYRVLELGEEATAAE